MSTLQHDEAMIQALAITKAQAGVRSMSAEEIVTYINDLVRAIRSTLDKNAEDDGQAEEKIDTEGLDPRKSIRENSVTCLECGQKFKMITKRHLRIHNLTPEEYKEKWGFRKNSSLACKSLQRMRRQKMKDMHIGDRRKNARKDDSAGGEGEEEPCFRDRGSQALRTVSAGGLFSSPSRSGWPSFYKEKDNKKPPEEPAARREPEGWLFFPRRRRAPRNPLYRPSSLSSEGEGFPVFWAKIYRT